MKRLEFDNRSRIDQLVIVNPSTGIKVDEFKVIRKYMKQSRNRELIIWVNSIGGHMGEFELLINVIIRKKYSNIRLVIESACSSAMGLITGLIKNYSSKLDVELFESDAFELMQHSPSESCYNKRELLYICPNIYGTDNYFYAGNELKVINQSEIYFDIQQAYDRFMFIKMHGGIKSISIVNYN